MELDAVQLSRLQPDIVLLHGLTKSDLAEQIAENLEGEALHIASADGAFTSVIIRGQFETCGTGQKYWTTQSNTEGVELVLAMPNLAEAGPTPVLVVEVDTPSGPSDIRHWHDRVGTAQHGVQSLTQSISTSNLVVVGDFAAPRSFRSLQSTLSGAGLIEAEVPASWPAGGGIFPLPGLHAFDRLWTGPAWSHQQSRRVRVLTQSRSLLVSDLMPDEVVQP